MFNPNEIPERCTGYLSRCLGRPVAFIRAEALSQSSRLAPWRLDTRVEGVECVYVLQVDTRDMEREYRVLKALESVPLPTPRVYGLDLQGEALGVACFFSEFIEGESVLGPLLAGADWAERLYLDAVCDLLAIKEADLGAIAQELERTTAAQVLEEAYTALKDRSLPLAEAVYHRLQADMPPLPPVRFSNGDLWLENFIVKDGRLAGVIDFQNACFSDPVFEFLLSFFVSPELCGRGIEERFCRRIGVDPAALHWYHGLEHFDAWPRLLQFARLFVHHTVQSVEHNLQIWLEQANCK